MNKSVVKRRSDGTFAESGNKATQFKKGNNANPNGRRGALKDIITNKENGYLVSPGNVDEIAKAIITLLDNPKDCDEISATNRNAVVLNYSIQNVVNKYIEIFNKI